MVSQTIMFTLTKQTLVGFNFTICSQGKEVATMKTQSQFMEIVKTNYMVVVIAKLGVFAFVSAVSIDWPAIAYIAVPRTAPIITTLHPHSEHNEEK